MLLASLFFGKPPVLNELAIRVVQYGDIGADVTPPKIPQLLILQVSSASTVGDVCERIQGTCPFAFEYSVLFNGKLLAAEAKVPSDCFESYDDLDDDNEAFRSRLVLCVDLSNPTGRRKKIDIPNKEKPAEETKVEEEIKQEEELDVEWQADKQMLVEEHFQSSLAKSTFELYNELEQIGCAQFYQQLQQAGFGSEGAFAMLDEKDFNKDNKLWIPHRARTRILALSDSVCAKISYINKTSHSRHVHHGTKTISNDIRAKILLATSQCEAAAEFDFSYIQEATPDTSNSSCCEKHKHIITKSREKLMQLSKARFESQLTASFSWITDIGQDLALFDNMFNIVLTLIRSNWDTVDDALMREYLHRASLVDLDELNIREFCSEQSVLSSYPLEFHSKSKLIQASMTYLEKTNSTFFMTYT